MTKLNKEGWEIKKLGEVCTKITDGSHNPPKGINQSDFLMISSQNIFDDEIRVNADTVRYLSEEDFQQENKRTQIEKGDVLLTIVGTIGRACVADGFTKIVLQRSVAVLKPNTDLSSRFLMHLIIGNKGKLNAEAHGVAQRGIYLRQLSNLPIPLPPLPIQQRIVEELDEINAIISAKKQQLSKLDELAQSIFYNMFGDPVTNEKGWEVKKYGEVFEIGSGGTPSKSKPEYWDKGNIPWIGSNMCQNCFIHETDGKFITEEGLNHSSAKLLEPNTVLVALVGATIGKTALLKTATSTNQNVAFIKTANNKAFTSEFVFFNLTSLYEEFMNIGNGDFKMANLSFVRNLPLIIPPLPLQETFAARVSAIEEEKAAIAASIEKMQTLLDARMQEYFG